MVHINRTKWNHNLVVTFVFRITSALSSGLWNSGTGSNYIYYLEDKQNTLVGLVQGLQGVFIPLASLPGGYIADRTRRDSVLKVLGAAGFVAIALVIAAVLAPKEPVWLMPSVDIKFGLLCIGYCFMGITQASNPIVESILADSVPTGGRSAIYTSLYFLGMLCRSVGPLIAAIIFVVDGNVWSVNILGKALFVGMLATVVPTSALFFFNDDRSLGVESEALGQLREPLAADSTGQEEQEEEEEEEAAKKLKQHQGPRILGLNQTAIPFILSVSDLIYGLASGCTIKFFPIFFAKEVRLEPVAVNVLMAAQPIAIGLCATLSQRLSVSIGRIQVLLLLRLVGWSAMGLMGLWTGLWGNAPLVIIIFLIRTGVNNAGYPIQKSILMDHVPKKNRGKWSAVDSLTAFGWSGSAFLGGILVDRAGFDWCFLITAMAQATGWALEAPDQDSPVLNMPGWNEMLRGQLFFTPEVLIPLLALVPRREVDIKACQEEVEAAAPLLGPVGGCNSQQAGGGHEESQIAGQRPATPSGVTIVVARNSVDFQEADAPTGDEEEFVSMIGSLKSPRRPIESWSES